jgi:hypothetical protein
MSAAVAHLMRTNLTAGLVTRVLRAAARGAQQGGARRRHRSGRDERCSMVLGNRRRRHDSARHAARVIRDP